ncbi:MAG: hypothetical protein GX154_12685 [Clostridiales bacterium]|jgi:DNA/RNA-binding domain of Phe-tRNA-synthetase-like protein|nr:hypothetical protein [Clostridiales bacterium]
MKKFRIESGVFDIFPKLHIGVLTFQGIDNEGSGREDVLKNAYNIFCERIKDTGAAHPNIMDYKDAMKMIKRKKGCSASIEAMAKRAEKGGDMYSINPIVDLYNSVSLKSVITFGGEDLDKISGDMVLGFAKGDEEFIPLGENENSPPREGELIYKDDMGAVVRSWLWREADRTKLTNETTNALIYMELVNENRVEEFYIALNEAYQLVLDELGGKGSTAVLTKDSPECFI